VWDSRDKAVSVATHANYVPSAVMLCTSTSTG
jgi:hypothetical protein